MKKALLILMFSGALLWMAPNRNCLSAQELTVPDYSYGEVYAEHGAVTSEGVANPGPYGGYSTGEDEKSSYISLAQGYRWWGYPEYGLLICGDKLPRFDFPGFHGVWDMSNLACSGSGDFMDSYMGTWGSIITDPGEQKIWALVGAKHNKGPIAQYCIPNPFGSGQICYNIPSSWGYGSSYGYLRKVVVVQSTGSLQNGDPVDINASLSILGSHEGEGLTSSTGVLFLNKFSETPWYQWGIGRDYLRWGDVEDIVGTPELMNNMLGNFVTGVNNQGDFTATVVIGDTIMVEVAFNNTIKLDNPGASGEAEGWNGEKPSNLFTNIVYTRTDSIRNLIKKHGNSLTYDLISLTTGAILEPLSADGPNTDGDKDGISDAREKGPDGNNDSFDGNIDGTPDFEQANVSSFHTFDGQNYVTLVVPEGTKLSQLLVTDNPSPLDAPADTDFNYGFFDFSIDGLELGEAITVTLILHNVVSVDKYYKYGMTPDDPTLHWYEFTYDGQTGAEIDGNKITLHFVDGLRGDEDITENGSIKEPGGPSKSISTHIPSVAENRGIKVYPKPATDHIVLQLNNTIPANDYSLIINSIAGKTMRKELIHVNDASQEFVIQIGDLPSGVYFITLSGNNCIYKSKFIKLK